MGAVAAGPPPLSKGEEVLRGFPPGRAVMGEAVAHRNGGNAKIEELRI